MLPNLRSTAAAALFCLLPSALAQTYSLCNPTKQDGCPADTALGGLAQFNWTGTEADDNIWNTTLGTISWAEDGAEFSVGRKGDAPTLQSLFYIFWGRVSIIMKAAPGTGIVSSIVLESDDLDEVDWEFIGGNTSFVQTNFFGKGDTTTYDRAVWYPVDNTLNAHNYTTVWTQEQLEWYIDDVKVRTLTFDDPLAQSKNVTPSVPGDRYPQTPMNIRLGPWAGGDPTENNEGTVEWAGGSVDYSKGPFVQTVMQVEAHDYSTGKQYTYSDKTGDWESIKAVAGNSTILERINDPTSFESKFKKLPAAAKAGIAIAAASIAGVALLVLGFCCIKSRRAGKKEKALADAEWEANLQELQRYKRAMVAEEEIHPRAGYI